MEYWNRLTLDPDPADPSLPPRSEAPTEKNRPELTLNAISSVTQAESTAKNLLDRAIIIFLKMLTIHAC